MFISNTPDIVGYQITESIGLVTGSVVQSKHIGRDIMAGLKTIIGGEVAGYTEMLVEAREKAVRRMISEAQVKGANAVVNVRFTTNSIAAGMSEILVYGTAVVAIKN